MDPQQLREATRAEHEATEALLPLGHAGLQPEEYARALRALAPIVRSWERWAERHAPADLTALVAARVRSHWVEADLRWLTEHHVASGEHATGRDGVVWDAVMQPALAQAPTVADPQDEASAQEAWRAAFLGGMYVMEGSTLGGRFLAKHVLAELGEAYRPATTYFSGHGEHTGAMWREVTCAIRAVPASLSGVTLAAAKGSFAAFGAALQAASSESLPQSPTRRGKQASHSQ